MRVERVDFALVGSAHGTARAVEGHRGIAALPPVLRILAKARGEDVLEAAAGKRLARALIERVKVAALPELVLERIGVARRALQLEHLEEDPPPRPDRRREQQDEHRLDDDRGLRDQNGEGEIRVHVQSSVSMRAMSGAGMRAGRRVDGLMHASATRAWATISLPRRTS